MPRYTLKTYYNDKQLEVYEHRSIQRIRSIISHPKIADQEFKDGWGNPVEHVNKIVLLDPHRTKVFEGSVHEAIAASFKL
jgi:hypothetical protein